MSFHRDSFRRDSSHRIAVYILGFFLCVAIFPPTLFAQPQFEGVTLTVGVKPDSIGKPAIEHAKTWEAKTGGKVNVAKMPFGELFREFLGSMRSPDARFDVIIYPPAWAGDFAPFLSDMPENLMKGENFDDIHETYRDRLMKWGDRRVAVTLDGDLFCGYYRKDLFADAEHQKAFKAQYGYDLAPPDTWAQYRDIAEFFTGKSGPDGKKLYGATEAFARGGQQFWFLFSRASAYTNHPDDPGGQFFDPETMKARIGNPAWQRALKDFVEILKFCPPDSLTYGPDEMRKAFAGGEAVMSIEWGDTAQISADPETSSVAGKVGYFVLPGSRDVWNPKAERWDTFDTVHKAPFLAFGGWVASVPKNNSPHPQAAWDYILWYGSPENSLKDVVTSGTGINPYRYSHLSKVEAWTGAFPKKAAAEYLGVIRQSLDSPHAASDLRLPGFFEYTEVLEQYLEQALIKKITPAEALSRVARVWDRITDKYGRERQLAIYRASMGLPEK